MLSFVRDREGGGRGRGRAGSLFAPWLLFAATCAVMMGLWPGEETVPYHLGYAAFALAYGLDVWTLRRALAGLTGYTVATGAVLVQRAATGVVAWEETSEIPMMLLIMLLMVWHVRRRQESLAQVTRMAATERERSRARELLARMTSHEMRTPVTIALGYLDLVLSGERDASRRADLAVVQDELNRLSRGVDRMVRMIRAHESAPRRAVDLDRVLRQSAERWSAVADRRWVVTSHVGTHECAPERLRAMVDTLVENSVRYTGEGDTVRLVAFEVPGGLAVGVADAGPGLPEELLRSVNQPGRSAPADTSAARIDPLAQTGLGLELVREVARAAGGRVVAGRSAEGGALVLAVVPRQAAAPPRATHPEPLVSRLRLDAVS